MQDYQYVWVNEDSSARLRKLLNKYELLEVAREDRNNRFSLDATEFGFGVHLRLPIEDQRIQRLLAALRASGKKPSTRVDREYTEAELDAAPFLEMIVATAGFYGGVDFGQAYDFTDACPRCGSGARAIAPLISEFRMGKKDIDHLVYENHLIVSQRLAKGLRGLTGFQLTPVRSRRRNPEPRFSWLRIMHELAPARHDTPGWVIENRCNVCSRTGYYRDHDAPSERVYDSLRGARDFNLTWEYCGDWQQVRSETHTRPIGGRQFPIVSQRARKRLIDLGVERLQWAPVRQTN